MSLNAYHYEHITAPRGSPLLFTFHGTGGDEHQFSALVHQLAFRAALISPRGDVSENGALRFFKRTAEGIYNMPDLQARTATMATFVNAHIKALAPSRVIGLGYSNGANLLASMLFQQADLFDDAILMHPLIPFEPDRNGSLSAKRILITAGRNDPICPAPLTRKLADHFAEQGAVTSTKWHEGGHEIQQGELKEIAAFLT